MDPSPTLPSMHFELELTQQLLVVARGVSFLVDLGPGAAVGGMRLEKNIRYSHPWAISFFSTRYDIDTI